MQLIITSFLLYDFIRKFNFKYKFLFIGDFKKKIDRGYLQESRILYFYQEEDEIKNTYESILNYNKRLMLYLFNVNEFKLNNYSLFFFNEFIENKLQINELKNFFEINEIFDFPKIIFNKKFKKNIVITGVCRNISIYVFNVIHKFIYLTLFFDKVTIIIYENDSDDNTLEMLKKFQKMYENINIIILSEKNIEGKLTQRISYARNYILDYIHNNNLNPDYIISIDMDEILMKFRCKSIIHPLNETLDWAMFGGNSKIYYDMWALRTLKKPNKDFWKNKKDSNQKYIMSKEKILEEYFMIDKESNPIEVSSCFNGIGIYKYKYILNCRYNGDETCEHINFHNEMKVKNEARFYIHPKLMVGPHKILGKDMDFYEIKKLVKNNL